MESGLREEDIAKAFPNLIRRKLSKKKDFEKTFMFKPPTPSDFLISLHERNPFFCLFSSISWSINPRHRNHSMVAESWERLITKKNTPTTTSLSLTVHRITGSKEATTLLHRLDIGISYGLAVLH